MKWTKTNSHLSGYHIAHRWRDNDGTEINVHLNREQKIARLSLSQYPDAKSSRRQEYVAVVSKGKILLQGKSEKGKILHTRVSSVIAPYQDRFFSFPDAETLKALGGAFRLPVSRTDGEGKGARGGVSTLRNSTEGVVAETDLSKWRTGSNGNFFKRTVQVVLDRWSLRRAQRAFATANKRYSKIDFASDKKSQEQKKITPKAAKNSKAPTSQKETKVSRRAAKEKQKRDIAGKKKSPAMPMWLAGLRQRWPAEVFDFSVGFFFFYWFAHPGAFAQYSSVLWCGAWGVISGGLDLYVRKRSPFVLKTWFFIFLTVFLIYQSAYERQWIP